MAFEDWFIARARVSSKMHKSIAMDDKMTLLPAALDPDRLRHAAVAGGADRRRAEPEHQIAQGAGANRRPRGLGQFAARRRRQLYESLPPPLDRSHPHRRSHRANVAGAVGTQQANPGGAGDATQDFRRHDVSVHLGLRRHRRGDRHALARRAHVRQNVQRHGRGTAGHHAIRGRFVELDRAVRNFRAAGRRRRGVRLSLVRTIPTGAAAA